MHPLNILDHTVEREDKWKLDRMKTWKKWSRQGEDEGEVGDLMKKVEDGEVDAGAGAHTGMTGDPPFLCEEEQTG